MGTAERRLEIMKYLCKARFATMSDLAKKFDVSVRTIKRDIDFLMLQKDCSNKKFGLQAIREALLWDLKNGTISKKNYLLLYDHLRFMRYRIVLWKREQSKVKNTEARP